MTNSQTNTAFNTAARAFLGLLTLFLLLTNGVSCAPAAPEKDRDGLLSASEIASFEKMYWMSREELLEALSFTEEDVLESDESGVMLSLLNRRTVYGYELTPYYEISRDPRWLGMYRVRYISGSVPDLDVDAATDALYQEAWELYGEPSIDLYMGYTNDEPFYQAYWEIGEETTFDFSVSQGFFSLSYRYRISLFQ